MVRTGAHERQAQGLVDTMRQAQVFDRDQTLVVVHRDHQIRGGLTAGAVGVHEHRVWRVGASNLQSLLLGDGDGGRYVVDFF